MKLILHIGMGKTGTSSIQNALRTSSAELAEQKVQYLGMWFDAIDPKFKGHAGLQQFLALDEGKLQSAAKEFANFLSNQTSANETEIFIMSNEALFGAVHKMIPFLKTLQTQIDLTLVLYIRDPHSWLPSAYTQWSLHHKTLPGPLQNFSQHAPVLLCMYQNIEHWLTAFPDNLVTRKHQPSADVTKDFAEACGIGIGSEQKRVLDRSEPIETLLRAAFNSRYETEVPPERFDRFVIPLGRKVGSLVDLTETCFKYDCLSEIIDERRNLFESIRDRLGPDFDFLGKHATKVRKIDEENLKARLLDYLVEITFLQSERIKRLENQMLELRKDQ